MGKESTELYNRRFEIALEHTRVAMWDYPGAIRVPLSDTGESVVIHNWVIKGFLNTEGEMLLNDTEPNFDVDEYKIIRRFLKQNQACISPYAEL